MTELTPERIRDAAEVVRVVKGYLELTYIDEHDIRAYALAREVEDFKRGALLNRLVDDLIKSPTALSIGAISTDQWRRVANYLVERYPALLESSEDSND